MNYRELFRKKSVVLAVTALVITVGMLAGISSRTRSTAAIPQDQFVIIIDAGHGGIDGGAVGVNGTVEKRINLEIALQLRDVLCSAGYNVIMTRDTDISIHDSSADTVREMKVSDLHNRLKMTELYRNSLLVSIHQNTLTSPSVTGAQVFYSPNNPASEQLARSIQDQFDRYIQPGAPRETKKAGKNLFLFYNAKNTAVLAECGFLSNAEEERLLCSPEHQRKLVFCLYKGLLEHIEENSSMYGLT